MEGGEGRQYGTMCRVGCTRGLCAGGRGAIYVWLDLFIGPNTV